MAGVAVRASLQIILVVSFCCIEFGCGCHFGYNSARPFLRGFHFVDELLGDALLLIIQIKNRRAVRRTEIVALPVSRRRVVNLEHEFEQLAVGGSGGVEHHFDCLGMAAVVS